MDHLRILKTDSWSFADKEPVYCIQGTILVEESLQSKRQDNSAGDAAEAG